MKSRKHPAFDASDPNQMCIRDRYADDPAFSTIFSFLNISTENICLLYTSRPGNPARNCDQQRQRAELPAQIRLPENAAAQKRLLPQVPGQGQPQRRSRSGADLSISRKGSLRGNVWPLFCQHPLGGGKFRRPRAPVKPANAKIALIKEKSEAIFASCVSPHAACGHLRPCKLPCLQVCFLVLRAFALLWQSVDFVNILRRRKIPPPFSRICRCKKRSRLRSRAVIPAIWQNAPGRTSAGGGAPPRRGRDGRGAVSYTHLDVYKRQHQDHFRRLCAGFRQRLPQWHVVSEADPGHFY